MFRKITLYIRQICVGPSLAPLLKYHVGAMTCCQQLQPLPNDDPTIACYLGHMQFSFVVIVTAKSLIL